MSIYSIYIVLLHDTWYKIIKILVQAASAAISDRADSLKAFAICALKEEKTKKKKKYYIYSPWNAVASLPEVIDGQLFICLIVSLVGWLCGWTSGRLYNYKLNNLYRINVVIAYVSIISGECTVLYPLNSRWSASWSSDWEVTDLWLVYRLTGLN